MYKRLFRAAKIAPYGPFQSGDGNTVYFGVQNDREWRRFCAIVLERPELADDVRFASNALRVTHRDELHAIIDEVCAALSTDTLFERLEAADIANGRMNTVQQFLDHPQLSARNRWRDVESPSRPAFRRETPGWRPAWVGTSAPARC